MVGPLTATSSMPDCRAPRAFAMRSHSFFAGLALMAVVPVQAQDKAPNRVYENRLTPLKDPPPLLADHPDYVEPIKTGPRFEEPMLIGEPDADLRVRAWRFSYNARGI